MGVVGSLAVAQLRHRPWRWGLLAFGVALTITVPVVSSGVAKSVAAQTVRRTVSQLDVADRSLLVTQEPSSAFRMGTPAQADARVRAQLATLTAQPVRRELVYRELTLAGSSFFFAGADRLASAVKIIDGRMPASCTPTHCEVVLIGSASERVLNRAVASLGLDVVGRAIRSDPVLVSGRLDTGSEPLLVGNGADAVGALSSLTLFGRTLAWAADLDVDRVVRIGVPAYVQRGAEVDSALTATVGGTTLMRPDDALQQEDRRAALSARRFGLLGGSAAVLLLGFAVVAAVGLRREHGLLITVLRRRGATTRQLGQLTTAQTVATCLAGALLGCAAGVVVSAIVAGNAGLPMGATVLHALSAATLACGLLTAAAAVLAAAVLLWPDSQTRTAWQLLDVLTACCLGAIFLTASRGSASVGDLASGGDPLVVALPVLTAITAGLIAARLWRPITRLAERAVPRSSVAGRIALLGSIRRPLRALATTAFLTAAVASVVFAGAYRSTLLDGSADQAAYTVPLDATLTTSPAVVSPGAVVNQAPLRAVVPGAEVYPTLRTSGTVQSAAGVATGLPVVGIDSDAVARMHRWSRTTGSTASAATVADRLRTPAVWPGPHLPTKARVISIKAAGLSPDISLTLWVRDTAGNETAVPLTQRGGWLVGSLPTSAAGRLQATAVVVQEQADYATHHQHAIGEGNTDQPIAVGTLTFSRVQAEGALVAWTWAGWGAANATVQASDERLVLTYRLLGSQVVATPGFVPNAALPALPVAVDPTTAKAAHDELLPVKIADQQVTVRVVATMPRLPTVNGSFLLADRATLVSLLDRTNPGSGVSTELWVAVPPSSRQALDRTLTSAPYDRLTVARRDAVQANLNADPVGRGSQLLLAIVGVLALAVATASLVLLIVGERRDAAGEFYAWESDGVRPSALRRVMLVRTLTVVGVALPVGLLAGLAVAVLGTRLVAVDASGSTPQPPLQVTVSAGWTLLVLLAGLLAGVLAVWIVAARALRERIPVRPEVDLR
jgi:hypothetical protein